MFFCELLASIRSSNHLFVCLFVCLFICSFIFSLLRYSVATGNTSDRKFLKSLNCNYLVIDEGHMLKNMQSQRYQGLMKMKVRFLCRLRPQRLVSVPQKDSLQKA